MTISLPARRTGRRTALAATLALAASGFAFAAVTDAAEAKPCPPDICDPVVYPKPKFPWPPGPVCLSCPDRIEWFERYQEIVLPEVEVVGAARGPRPARLDGGGGINRPSAAAPPAADRRACRARGVGPRPARRRRRCRGAHDPGRGAGDPRAGQRHGSTRPDLLHVRHLEAGPRTRGAGGALGTVGHGVSPRGTLRGVCGACARSAPTFARAPPADQSGSRPRLVFGLGTRRRVMPGPVAAPDRGGPPPGRAPGSTRMAAWPPPSALGGGRATVSP